MAANFDNKVVLVTGGNSGIGFATARAFAQAGAQVVLTGRSQASVTEAAGKIGSGALGLSSNAADLNEISRLIETIDERFGRIDVLFANAGVSAFLPIAKVTEQDWDEVHSVNLKGVYFLVQKAIRIMPQGSTIIINASIGATKVAHGSTLYSTTKSAVRTLGRGLAIELAPQGIRVNIVSPGPIDTPLPHRTKGIDDVNQFIDAISETTLLKRMGRPEELASTVLFLASDEASFVVGAELIVDGGFLLM